MSKRNNNIEEQISFKIITLGDSQVGKTSIIKRYLENKFTYESTLTVGFIKSKKKIILKNKMNIFLELCDTSGQERFASLSPQYVKNADAVLFVFDLNNKKSFNNIKNWMKFFKDNTNSENNMPTYLIGNKKDLEKNVEDDEIEIFKDEHKDIIYKETSAKEEDNQIEELFREMGELLYDKYKKNPHKNKSNKRNLSKYDENKRGCPISKCIV